MLGLSLAISTMILAQAAGQPAAPQTTTQFLAPMLPLLPVLFVFYFLMIRPQQQQERKRKAMIDAMSKGDEVLTGAGIYGTVMSINKDEDKVVLRVDDDRGVKMSFSRSSIVKVLDSTSSKKSKDKAVESV